MINFYSENKVYELIDLLISKIIDQIALELCIELESSQNIINSNDMKDEIIKLNSYIQKLLKNNFSEQSLDLDRRLLDIKKTKRTLSESLLCNRINIELDKLLIKYDENILIYNIIFERKIYINKLLHNEAKVLAMRK